MKVLFVDAEGRKRHLAEVSEVVVLDDEENPINVSVQQGALVTCCHASEGDFAEVIRKCGLVPPEVKVIG